MRRVLVVAGVAQLVLCACAAPAVEAERRALLIEPGVETRAELQRAVDAALHGAQVTLADDALTSNSELIVERRLVRDASGRIVSGREGDRPQHFSLVIVAGRCVLVHEESGWRMALETARCKAAP